MIISFENGISGLVGTAGMGIASLVAPVGKPMRV
jgi:hypothetical protein